MDHVKNVLSQADSKIREVVKMIDDSPNTAEAVKKELSHMLDSVSLDGKNALLTAKNTAQQALLLEKKIENLYLLLKQYDLNKQV